eukprot:m.357378 g.357378  ORF g.357378 m.357378 type:complete len:202 (+) comp17810_c0_seq1:178-783(+)
MRFRFCGDRDCPDWLLAEINLLTKLSSVKVKILVGNIIKDLTGKAPLDHAKLVKLSGDAKFGAGDLETFVAGVSFIVRSAARFNVDTQTLSDELQQLGLPKEHSQAICRAYEGNADAIRAVLSKQSLELWRLDDLAWRCDYLLGSSYCKEINQPVLSVKMGVADPTTQSVGKRTFTMTKDMLDVLVNDLEEAVTLMRAMEN